MDNKFRPLPNDEEEPKYQVYPSIERAEENLKYLRRLYGKDQKSQSTGKKKKSKSQDSIDDSKSSNAKSKPVVKREDNEKKDLKKTSKAPADLVTADSFNFPKSEKKPEKKEKVVVTHPTPAPASKVTLQKKAVPTKNPLSEKERKEVSQLIADAKQEEGSDRLTGGRSPVFARKKLIDKFMALYRRGIKLNSKQISYVKEFFYWHPQSLEPKYIRFLVPATVEVMGYNAAITTINELASVMEDTKYEEPLKAYGKFLAKKAKTVKILEMKKTGLSNEQIGEKIGLSSAEVAILAENTEKFVFTDEDVR